MEKIDLVLYVDALIYADDVKIIFIQEINEVHVLIVYLLHCFRTKF